MASWPSALKNSLRALLVLIGLGILLLGYLYVRLTAGVQAVGLQSPTALDAKEAARKLQLFADARAASKQGFIRLTEVELNSYVRERYLGGFDKPSLPEATQARGVVDCRADLSTNSVNWYCWLRQRRWAQQIDLCWVRRFSLTKANDRWALELLAMRVGDVEVPPRYWPRVTRWLGNADQLFAEESAWLAEVPALELRPNEFSKSPELRLYTYAEAVAIPAAHR